MSEQQSDNFWGSARDIGLIAIAALTFTGSVAYYYYLNGLGIHIQLSGIDPMNILIIGVSTLQDFPYGESMEQLISGAVVLLLIAALLFVSYHRKGFAQKMFRAKAAQIIIAAAGFGMLYFIARTDGSNEAVEARQPSSALSKVIFKDHYGAAYPSWLSAGDGVHVTNMVLETHDAIYLLSQDQRGGNVAQIFEINRDQVSAIETLKY